MNQQLTFRFSGASYHPRVLLDELASYSAFGEITQTERIEGETYFINEFWTSRQRQAHRIHEVSYRACFKPQLPAFFIDRLSQPGDIVYDPFMGRGTTPVEAALRGRVPYGNDTNPLSRAFTEPRINPPTLGQITNRLAEYSARVECFDLGTHDNLRSRDKIVAAMRAACYSVRVNPIERSRPNEVGNDMEPFVISALRAQGLDAAAPKTKSGKGKTTGYPDVKITGLPIPIFLEVKTYAAANHTTTQRSFYLSPAEDHKVTDDGYHLLVGFEIVRNGNLFTPAAFKLVDLYGLDCDMKAEFNSDNRRLYEQHRILASERIE